MSIKIQSNWLQENGLYKCPECGIEKSKNGICSHILFKHRSENFISPFVKYNEEIRKKVKNKKFTNQFDKANKLGLKIEVTQETKNRIQEKRVKTITNDWREKHSKRMSKIVQTKMEQGIYPKSCGRAKYIEYNNIVLHGSWELAYAKWLDKNQVKWRKVNETFSYEFENKKHRYTPDFYLIDTNEYIEIKGYQTEKDKAKWEQFPLGLKLKVLKLKELKELKVL